MAPAPKTIDAKAGGPPGLFHDRRQASAPAVLVDVTARVKALQARADAVVACEIGNLPANDHPAFAECLAASIRVQLVKHHGAASTVSILSREACEAGRGILPKKVAQAEAERLFMKAANDGGEG